MTLKRQLTARKVFFLSLYAKGFISINTNRGCSKNTFYFAQKGSILNDLTIKLFVGLTTVIHRV